MPDTYPMTLNALRSACNQRSSRDPVVDYDEATVVAAADELREHRLVRLVHQPGGRAAKYRHRLDEELTLDEPSLALVSVLLLRGPQTVGELRTRTERQFAFDSLDHVEAVLDRLSARDGPLVRILPRRPGQKDQRWTHLLGGEPSPLDGEATPTPRPTSTASGAPPTDETARPDRLAALEARVEALESRLDELIVQLGGGEPAQPER